MRVGPKVKKVLRKRLLSFSIGLYIAGFKIGIVTFGERMTSS